jgi:ATP-dependent Lhr-like helicase
MDDRQFDQNPSGIHTLYISPLKALNHDIHQNLKMPYPLKPGTRFEIQQINNHPAAESPFADHLLKTGFEKDGAKLVLWPSAMPS